MSNSKMSNKKIKKWVDDRCNHLYLENLIGLPTTFEKVLYKIIQNVKDDIEKNGLPK